MRRKMRIAVVPDDFRFHRDQQCSPDGIRTRATALRGRRPRPLDDGAAETSSAILQQAIAGSFAGVPGLEPRLTEPESVVLPITPYPKGAATWPGRTVSPSL